MGKIVDGQAQKLYDIIDSMCYHGGSCYATNTYFSKQLGVGSKQVQNYLNKLRDEGRILITTSRLHTNAQGKLYKKRMISTTAGKVLNSQELLLGKMPESRESILADPTLAQTSVRSFAKENAEQIEANYQKIVQEQAQRKAEETRIAQEIAADDWVPPSLPSLDIFAIMKGKNHGNESQED